MVVVKIFLCFSLSLWMKETRETRIHAVLSSLLFFFYTHVMCVELVCFETFLVIGIQFSCFFPCRLFLQSFFFRCCSLCSFRAHVLLKCFWDFKIYFILSIYPLKYCLWAICTRSFHSVCTLFSFSFLLLLLSLTPRHSSKELSFDTFIDVVNLFGSDAAVTCTNHFLAALSFHVLLNKMVWGRKGNSKKRLMFIFISMSVWMSEWVSECMFIAAKCAFVFFNSVSVRIEFSLLLFSTVYVFMMYQEWWYYSRLNALNGFKNM